jgi:hypothetical protein
LLFAVLGLTAASLNQSIAFMVVEYLVSFSSCVCVAFATGTARRSRRLARHS